MRRKKITLCVLICIYLSLSNQLLQSEGIEVNSADYTVNAVVGNSVKYEIDYLVNNSVPSNTTEINNIIELLDGSLAVKTGDFIELEVISINETYINYTKEVSYTGSQLVSLGQGKPQPLNEFSITNYIMTNNETLIEEMVTKQNIMTYNKTDEEIIFTNITENNETTIAIQTIYDIQSGFLKDLWIEIVNNTDGTDLFIIDLCAEKISMVDDPNEGKTAILVDPDDYTTGLTSGDRFKWNLTADYIDLGFLLFPVGFQYEIEITEINETMINYLLTWINPNGTKIFEDFPGWIPRYEIDLGFLIITTNTTLIDNCGIYPSFNISYGSNTVIFTQEVYDEWDDEYRIYEYEYSTITGVLEKQNVTKTNYNKSNVISHRLFELIESSTGSTTTITTTESETTNISTVTECESQTSSLEISVTTMTTTTTITGKNTPLSIDLMIIAAVGVIILRRRKK